MMNREEGEARRAFWMQHLRECSSAGERLSSYARRHGLNVGEGYQWRRVLRREGLWRPVGDIRASARLNLGKSVG
jgi:transposase-like protein